MVNIKLKYNQPHNDILSLIEQPSLATTGNGIQHPHRHTTHATLQNVKRRKLLLRVTSLPSGDVTHFHASFSANRMIPRRQKKKKKGVATSSLPFYTDKSKNARAIKIRNAHHNQTRCTGASRDNKHGFAWQLQEYKTNR